ncbi:type I-G CRISPR-associated helicase/endonuclease Cas3g [Symbiobacterium terraclitae]|uniref:type I-G CRISPR-associated helicase/endonuclease Cas3g n=1 Tax=Symbiobacterium terraclitae TaxID=557451 RepID=UPI0035B549AB
MAWPSYSDFFSHVTRGRQPYKYQVRLAECPEPPPLIHLPTGVGKTLATVLAWAWRRLHHPDSAVREATPRRLVYCLPVRNLVEQTVSAINDLDLGVPVCTIMGGEQEEPWYLHPEREAILVGTLDMLLSRALNRGYAMSRYRWPVAFGLLNNDVLWVMDEVQLFGVGLETSAQLQAFRERLGTFGPAQTIWMSATLQPKWFATVDHAAPENVFHLLPDEAEELSKRVEAPKQLARLHVGSAKDKGYAAKLAAAVLEHHQTGTLTLVICNTVERATQVYRELHRRIESDLLLLHSRFRPLERSTQVARLLAPVPAAGRIAICTQVVEAGVDLDARTLITELAPWPSLVQRFGRCNRQGRYTEARVLWVDVSDRPSPYTAEQLVAAREHLVNLDGRSVAPAYLPPVSPQRPEVDLLRRRDLVDLFDTTPDLMGNDVDVSRFIREGEEHDLYLFWRAWADETDRQNQASPGREELCAVPVADVREWLRRREDITAWVYDHLFERWRQAGPRDIRPGGTLMLAASSGGYDPQVGWDPGAKGPVAPVPASTAPAPEGYGGDPASSIGCPQSIAEHTDEVVAALSDLLAKLPWLAPIGDDLLLAARYHDLGKSHAVFQETMRNGLPPELRGTPTLWAKTQARGLKHSVKGFRHELASALALCAAHPDRFLPAYLAGAHHGRVRLTIRSLPEERLAEGGRRVMGITDGDVLPPVDLGGGYHYPGGRLDTALTYLGGDRPSWTEQAIALRERPDLGPFRMAYLEAVLRAADQRASAAAADSVAEGR